MAQVQADEERREHVERDPERLLEHLFTRTVQQDSEWQASLILARAQQQKGDSGKAREYAKRSEELLAGLEQKWGKDPYSNYLSRPDVAYGRQQLQQLLADVK